MDRYKKSILIISPILVLSFTATKALAQSSRVSQNSVQNPYKRTAGFGFSNPYHSNINYPTFGTPQPTGNGYFLVPSGSAKLPMWKAPSGYLYPWAPRPANFFFRYPMPILMVPQKSTVAAPAVPPLLVVIRDLEHYISDAKSQQKILAKDALTIEKRLADIKSKEHRLRITGGGIINQADEAQMRRELDKTGSEIARISHSEKIQSVNN